MAVAQNIGFWCTNLNVKLKLKANVILFLFWQVRLRKQGFSMFTAYTLYNLIFSVAAKGHLQQENFCGWLFLTRYELIIIVKLHSACTHVWMYFCDIQVNFNQLLTSVTFHLVKALSMFWKSSFVCNVFYRAQPYVTDTLSKARNTPHVTVYVCSAAF